ncbi:phage holin family protein [Steroidobacter cummioxidans]|uniref:phage holin family protein n=1 Tax=Steroidobacter cummioxidans TaxID=1803913 RepID=UPI000E31847B|nr:phage holin family protein [Steroidobacter cummioxidans]
MASSPISGGGPTDASVAGLLSRLMDDALALARNEIALAKAEARTALRDVKLSIVPFAIAFGVSLAGALTLVATIVLALSEVMRPWLAALIVSIVLLIAGFILLKAGTRKWSHLREQFDRTQESLHKDATVVARRT